VADNPIRPRPVQCQFDAGRFLFCVEPYKDGLLAAGHDCYDSRPTFHEEFLMRLTSALLAALVVLAACPAGQSAITEATTRGTDDSPVSRMARILDRVSLPSGPDSRLERRRRKRAVSPKAEGLKRGNIEETYDKWDYPHRPVDGRR
jgi:hypothetical protein